MARFLRMLVLTLATLVPLLTFFHRDDRARWTTNRCAMAAPDELSYLLVTRNFAQGRGPSIRPQANAESFYPPGFPACLAAWARGVTCLGGDGLSLMSLHLCVALLLCATVPLVYLVACRLIAPPAEPSFAAWAALAVTLLYATNWFVLENALFLFSEPLFTLLTLLWLLVALKNPYWCHHLALTLLMALLAVAAMAIRSAGIVCVVTTVVYPLLLSLRRAPSSTHPPLSRAWLWRPVMITLLLASLYAVAVHLWMPPSEDAYSAQLIRGITDGDRFPNMLRQHGPRPAVLLQWAGHLLQLAVSHFDDWSQNFTPLFRDQTPRPALYYLLARFGLFLALAGWLWQAFRRRRRASRLPELYVAFYISLYALWPFNMTRFWVPIYPLMLAYSAIVLREFPRLGRYCGPGERAAAVERRSRCLAVLYALLMLGIFVEELVTIFPYYQRRLNYVSDVLAQTASFVRRHSPNGRPILIVPGGDEAKTMAWYLNAPPCPALPGRRGIERQILAQMDYVQAHPGSRLFVMSYFAHDDMLDAFANLHHDAPSRIAPFSPNAPATPDRWTIRQQFRIWNITRVWEFIPPSGLAPSPSPAAAPPSAALPQRSALDAAS